MDGIVGKSGNWNLMLRALKEKCHDTADRAVVDQGRDIACRCEVCRPGYVNLHDRVRAGSAAIDADEVVDIALR